MIGKLHFPISWAEMRVRELWDAYCSAGSDCDWSDYHAMKNMRDTLDHIIADWESRRKEMKKVG